MKKNRLFLVTLIVALSATLLVPTSSNVSSYDPWLDLNDDGVIDVNDLYILAYIYSTSGDAMNKTALLLELQARIDSLNMSLLTDYYNMTECDVIFVDASGDTILGYLDVDSGTLYVDDVNNRVGIGTTSPGAKLTVVSGPGSGAATFGGDNSATGNYAVAMGYSSNASGVYSIAAGWDTNAGGAYSTAMGYESTTIGSGSTAMGFKVIAVGTYSTAIGSNIIVNGLHSFGIGLDDTLRTITQDNTMAIMGGNVGIGTSSPTEKLDVNGNLNVDGSITINTVTRYYSIPAIAWLPYMTGWWDIYRNFNGVYVNEGGGPGDFRMFAEVNLPHGAVVTEFKTWVYDNFLGMEIDPEDDITVSLVRVSQPGGGEGMANVATSGASASWQELTDSTIDSATVDNQNYAYIVFGHLGQADNSHQLSSVHITYTVNEPLP